MRNTTIILVAAVAAIVLWVSPAQAFHDDGVAHCNGCHTMHNSQNGVAMNYDASGTGPGTAVGVGHNDLLLFANKSDVCLECHAGNGSYHVWSDDMLAPTTAERGGGDFVFLEEDNLNDGHGGGDGTCSGGGHDNETDCELNNWVWTWGAEAIPGQAAGHTIASGIKGTLSDTVLLTAPGGTFAATDLGCSSCHDPHGNDGYRLTYKDGQNNGGGIAFTNTIDASGISVFAGNESDGNHNTYRAGYSEWCGECHGDFHNASASLIHPSGELLDGDQVVAYNLYNGSTDCANNDPGGGNPCGSGTKATAYKAMIPLEQGAAFAGTATEGATDGLSGVACMSCHRAHASSAPDAGRWDFSVTGLEEDGHESGSYKIPNAYAGDTSQRSLCNKCHAQDAFDAIEDFTP